MPYAVVLVEFPDHPGVRVAGRLRGCPPEDAAVGMTVEVGFEPGPGGFAVPSFVASASTDPPSEHAPAAVVTGEGAAVPGEDAPPVDVTSADPAVPGATAPRWATGPGGCG
ncbi:OB-fold domain-containing protein, partial [Actinomadura sp. CNU-125]|uniref:OB-fold domain-containing protein n=1 Tax=Actinomadura sp. CNU-125 TaxID=1904961 RepID=UPI000B2C030B